MNHILVTLSREQDGRDATPWVGIFDSQSVKTAENGGPRGYDAGKKIRGRKQHITTDTLGHVVAAVVHPADVQDRDGRYAGKTLRRALAERGQWTIEIFKRGDRAEGFIVLTKRWIGERSFAWL
ncbi:Transposase IS4-like domain-containing protein [Komagataeibacter xylinus]